MKGRKPWVVPLRDIHQGLPDDELLVSCWCEEHLVRLTKAELHRGETRECGRPGCHRRAPASRFVRQDHPAIGGPSRAVGSAA